MEFEEAALVEVGVDFGGGDAGVAQEFLQDAEVDPRFQEMGGEGVTQGVGGEFRVDSRRERVFP